MDRRTKLLLTSLCLLGSAAASGCQRQATAPPAPPIAEATASPVVAAAEATRPTTRSQVRLDFGDGPTPYYASLSPAGVEPQRDKQWHPAEGFVFDTRGPGAYDLHLAFRSDEGRKRWAEHIVVIDEDRPVTVNFEHGHLSPGPQAWGVVWPSRSDVASQWTAFDEITDAVRTPDVLEFFESEDARTPEHIAAIRTILLDAERASHASIDALEDPYVQAKAMTMHVSFFSIWVEPRMPIDFGLGGWMSWVLEDYPLDHPVWVAEPKTLAPLLKSAGEAKMRPPAERLLAETSHPGVAAVVLMVQADWALERGDEAEYQQLRGRIARLWGARPPKNTEFLGTF